MAETFSYLLQSRKTRLIVCGALTLFYCILFMRIAAPHMFDTAWLGGDTREYQSMAVNFAKGHGIQRFGGLEKFEVYKFDNKDSVEVAYHTQEAGRYNFYRTPVYSLFVGLIYKVVGVSPYRAKQVQLVLLCIIAGFLPWLGYHFWKAKGFFSGLISGAIYLSKYYLTSVSILTESLIAFVVFLTVIAYLYFDSRRTYGSAALLGFMFGFGLLTKGSLLYVPIIILLLEAVKYFRKRDAKVLGNLVIASTVFALTILPWSVYATMNSDSLVILSTQGKAVLLDCNNEYCIDGNWHPEWIDRADSYFNNDHMEAASPALRVAGFYASNPGLFFRIMLQKVVLGFAPIGWLWIVLALFLIEAYRQILQRFVKNKLIELAYLSFCLIGLMVLIGFRFAPPMNFNAYKFLLFMLIPALLFVRKLPVRLPFIFSVFGINFLLITLLSFGATRYIRVMDFIFVLFAVYYMLEFILRMLETDFIVRKEPISNANP